MKRARRQKIAILGGGMAGLSAAWRLSDPGWQDEFDSITVFQRGWRLGGKGASSRGRNGRIEEHGLHIWLGYYENAFRLLRECYEELDRGLTDTESPIQTWRDAMSPSSVIGLGERQGSSSWSQWVTDLNQNDHLPGEPGVTGRELTVVEFVTQAMRLVVDYFRSVRGVSSDSPLDSLHAIGAGLTMSTGAVAAEIVRLLGAAAMPADGLIGDLTTASSMMNEPTRSIERDPEFYRTSCAVSLLIAAVRGILKDRLLTDARGFRAINNEEYLEWIQRHGGAAGIRDFPIVRGLYDLVFGYADGDSSRPSFSAGTAVLFGARALFDYKGSFFWKMNAGMGDVVFAPLYQALRNRGVTFEFFHRVDQLRLSPDGHRVDSITMGRQAQLAAGSDSYDPLVRHKGLPCFPAHPRHEQLAGAPGIERQPLESQWCTWPDAERRILKDGSDFDLVVFAIPPPMARLVCRDLVTKKPEWNGLVHHLDTVATQSFQIWLKSSESDLGWQHPGSTVSAYADPFNTWASMPQLIAVEEWPEADQPQAIGYFCGPLEGSIPTRRAEEGEYQERVRQDAVHFLDRHMGSLLPGAATEDGFRWELLCGAGKTKGAERFRSQYWRANVDPSDRYVQSRPGTDQYRLRSDEGGCDNLFLAGDWTDSGLNAGCIEAAVLSGIQAANAIHGRSLNHGVAGFFLP